ncbi:hypothetical protein BDV93DRAFT_563218 [Ceratobasidium sp. AG-I]|nr:hypothetical protein BDV93DRAFT_563218 [Ceratobasidium sp. AG-I]
MTHVALDFSSLTTSAAAQCPCLRASNSTVTTLDTASAAAILSTLNSLMNNRTRHRPLTEPKRSSRVQPRLPKVNPLCLPTPLLTLSEPAFVPSVVSRTGAMLPSQPSGLVLAAVYPV